MDRETYEILIIVYDGLCETNERIDLFLKYGSENDGICYKTKDEVYRLLAKHSPIWGKQENNKLHFDITLNAKLSAKDRASILFPQTDEENIPDQCDTDWNDDESTQIILETE